MHQRYRRRLTRYLSLANDLANDGNSAQSSPEVETTTASEINSGPGPSSAVVPATQASKCGLPTINEGCCEESPVVDIEDLLTPSSTEIKQLIPIPEDMYEILGTC